MNRDLNNREHSRTILFLHISGMPDYVSDFVVRLRGTLVLPGLKKIPQLIVHSAGLLADFCQILHHLSIATVRSTDKRTQLTQQKTEFEPDPN